MELFFESFLSAIVFCKVYGSIVGKNDASSIIYEEAGDDANVILGCVIDKNLTDEVRVTVIATGLNKDGILESDLRPFAKQVEKSIQPKYKAENEQIQTSQTKDTVSSNNNDISDMKDDNDKDQLMTFGDEFDVPAFIRNRK